jgi:pilus assembly protein CpaC
MRLLIVLFLSPILALSAVAGSKVYQLTDTAQVRNISIVMHNTDVLQFDEIIGSYAVGDPEVADILPIRGREAYIQGKKLGTTNLTVMSADGTRRAVFNIEVMLNVRGVLKTIKRAVPDADIEISTSNGRIILAGNVPDASSAGRILEITSKFVDRPDEVVNAMTITDAQQVMLEVRFLEVTRALGKEMGAKWLARSSNLSGASGGSDLGGGVLDPVKMLEGSSSSFASVLAQFTAGSFNIDVAIQALEAKGVTRRLAEPNLVALSGQQATFLAGGEIPYGVSQGDNASTQFKRYGVQLTFTPTVLRNDVINLKLVPEFSQPDLSGDVNSGQSGPPALLTRRAETMVELRDGQTFVIAGLLDGFNQRNVDQIPGIGDVPVLGILFRSAAFKKRETELIIVVTPRIIKPLIPGSPIVSPLDTMKSSSETDLFLKGQLETKPKRPLLAEPVGHILDIGG